jgi:hypothetical protein
LEFPGLGFFLPSGATGLAIAEAETYLNYLGRQWLEENSDWQAWLEHDIS